MVALTVVVEVFVGKFGVNFTPVKAFEILENKTFGDSKWPITICVNGDCGGRLSKFVDWHFSTFSSAKANACLLSVKNCIYS